MTDYEDYSSENWDWDDAQYQPKPSTARQRFEEVLSKQKCRFVETFNENPLYDVIPTPPPSPANHQADDYADWTPYEPNEASESYEVISESEDSTYESQWDSTESCEECILKDKLLQELKNLRLNLAKIEGRCTIVSVEQEMLMSQLADCEDFHDRLLDEADQLEDAIDEKLDELEVFEDEYIKASEQFEKDQEIMSMLINDIDEFSQSTQLLLNNALYFDMEDLIMKHIKKCESNDPVKVKKSIIAEANLIRKEQLKSAVEALDCYLVDRNNGNLLNFELK